MTTDKLRTVEQRELFEELLEQIWSLDVQLDEIDDTCILLEFDQESVPARKISEVRDILNWLTSWLEEARDQRFEDG